MHFRIEVLNMKLKYYKETDSIYIDLLSTPSASTTEISEGVMLDYDNNGNLTGIDIDNASKKIDLSEVILSSLPAGLQAQPA
jgi:uncharacterized protein YuzE